MAAQGDMMMDVQRAKPTINHRFSSLRFMRTVKQFNPIQRGYIVRCGMENMMKMPGHLITPMSLLQWLVDHIVPGSGCVFRKKRKIIHFTKDIVDKVFEFPPGNIPYTLESADPDVVREVEAICFQYLQGNKIPIKKLESILLGSNDEVVFVRSFVLYFITTVLCPSKYNFVKPKYLYSLTDKDMHQVQYLDYGNLCIDNLSSEIDNWKEKVFLHSMDFNKLTWIGGCLPLLGVVYMDFVNFNGNDGRIDYCLPRMAHVRNIDFVFLRMQIVIGSHAEHIAYCL